MTKKAFLIILSISLYLTGHYALVSKSEPLLFYFYVTSWWSYIILIDTILSRRTGKYVFLNKDLPLTVLISCGLWCSFELINLRLENWFYVNLPGNVFIRYSGYLLAYGTVIPAISITASALQLLFPPLKIPVFRIRNYPSRAIASGIFMLFLTLIWPNYLFPLAWVFAIPLIDGINYRAGFRSFMADIERGDTGRLPAALLSGLLCGALWETWNFLSPVRWIYTVPFFEGTKVFEMPLPGYAGFLVFGVETLAFANLLQGLLKKKTTRIVTICFALMICVFSFPLIDRFTVFSFSTAVERLSFLSEESTKMLRGKGIKTSLGIDKAALKPGERDAYMLVSLRGLGYENYLRLGRYGITRIEDLNNIDETTLSDILGETNLRRVRIFLNAARQQ